MKTAADKMRRTARQTGMQITKVRRQYVITPHPDNKFVKVTGSHKLFRANSAAEADAWMQGFSVGMMVGARAARNQQSIFEPMSDRERELFNVEMIRRRRQGYRGPIFAAELQEDPQ